MWPQSLKPDSLAVFLGEAMKDIRRELSLTQLQLAERIEEQGEAAPRASSFALGRWPYAMQSRLGLSAPEEPLRLLANTYRQTSLKLRG